ncbi:MAG: AzlC family ABC transporter permease [Polaromonas sp.]|nr:AzlC family ABC transporter permease [Polaromonas sp.]
MTALYKHPEFRIGARDMLALAPGMAAWGLMTGVAMIKSGMSLVEVLLMGLLVFAGSSQLAALPLIVAGAPMWVVLATTLCVNLRFMVFSVHLRAYVMHQGFWRRLASGYFTTDLTYVQFTKRFPHPANDAVGKRAEEAYLAGNSALNWVNWMAVTLLGITLANAIPVSWGLGFAGILALMGIMSSLATTRLRALAAVVAGSVAVVAYTLPLKLNIIVAIVLAVAVCLMLEKPMLADHAIKAKTPPKNP